MNKEEIIKREKIKLEKSKKLLKELNLVPFGIFNPRFWKVKKELDRIIKSFNLLK